MVKCLVEFLAKFYAIFMDELKKDRRYWLALSVCEGIGPV
jgi:hypothetical protein